MAHEVPHSWRRQFDESLRRLVARGGGAHALLQPSLDEYLGAFPLEPDSQWGPETDELHRAALRAAVLRQLAFISNDLELAAASCASPPERAMLYALTIVSWDWVDGVLLRVHGNASGLIATKGMIIEIEPQAHLGQDRVDFLLTMSVRLTSARSETAQMVVECDGHDWHERSPAQASHDRARDRRLQARDLAVYRYTGSDLWRDVFAAAKDAVGELARRFPD